MSTSQKIAAELLLNPGGIYTAATTDAQKIAIMNTETVDITTGVHPRDIVHKAGKAGVLGAIIKAQNDVDDAVANPARTIMTYLGNPHITSIDVNDAAFIAGIDALVAATILAPGHKTAFVAMGTITKTRAENEIGKLVTEGDFANARREGEIV